MEVAARPLALISALALVVFVASVALLHGGALLPPDTIDYAATARNLVRGDGYVLQMIPYHIGLLPEVSHAPEMHGILRPFELAPLYLLFGAGGTWAKVPSLAYVAGSSVVAFALARRTFGPVAGWIAALLVLTSKEFSFVAALGADDVGAAFWSLATVYCATRAVEKSSTRWWIVTGVAAGLATLEKFSCVLLVGTLMLGVLAVRRRPPLRTIFLTLAPPAVALLLYALRNYSVDGRFGFRFSVLEWLAKGNPSAYFAYYPEGTSLGRLWSSLGFSTVVATVLEETARLGPMVADHWGILIGGLLSLLATGRQRIFFAVVALGYLSALVVVACVAHHLELRYLFGAYSLWMVAVAGGVARVLETLGSKMSETWRSRSKWAAIVAASVWGGTGLYAVLSLSADLGARAVAPQRCAEAVQFVQQRVAPDDAVLTSDPWFVVWNMQRPAVNVPTNGSEALARVARHYGTGWALVGPRTIGAADLHAELLALSSGHWGLVPQLMHDGIECDVYALHSR